MGEERVFEKVDNGPLEYEELNATERRIVDGWIASGMTKAQALYEFAVGASDVDGDMDIW